MARIVSTFEKAVMAKHQNGEVVHLTLAIRMSINDNNTGHENKKKD